MKFQPLVFLEEESHARKLEKNHNYSQEYTNNEVDENIDYNDQNEKTVKSAGILNNLFDEFNNTQANDRELTILTPSRHKVYVADTPVEIQKMFGLSIIERRNKGLTF